MQNNNSNKIFIMLAERVQEEAFTLFLYSSYIDKRNKEKQDEKYSR